MKEKILLIEQDPDLLKFLKLSLELEGYQVISVNNDKEAIELFPKERPKLVLLDIMLPGANISEICQKFREKVHAPIILLIPKYQVSEKSLGLETEVDDYIIKPFDLSEVSLRIRAVLQRKKFYSPLSEKEKKKIGDLQIDFLSREVKVKNKFINLTPKEFELLSFLMREKGKVLSRDVLLDKIWGEDYFGDTRTVDVHIRRLRKKIKDSQKKPNYILTVWGIGYKFKNY